MSTKRDQKEPVESLLTPDEYAKKKKKKKRKAVHEKDHSPLRKKAKGEINNTEEPDEKTSNSDEQIIDETEEKEEFGDEWNESNRRILMNNVYKNMPHGDGLYVHQLRLVSWSSVAFGNFTNEECKEEYKRLINLISTQRSLIEIHGAVKRIVPKLEDKLVPAEPVNPYRTFWKKTYKHISSEINPDGGASMLDVSKKIKMKYDNLSEKEKKKLVKKFNKQKMAYKETLRNLKEEVSDDKSQGQLTVRPKSLFMNEKIEYAEKQADNQKSRGDLRKKYEKKWKNLIDNKRLKFIKKSVKHYEDKLDDDIKEDEKEALLELSFLNIQERNLYYKDIGRPMNPPCNALRYYLDKHNGDITGWKSLSTQDKLHCAKKTRKRQKRYQQEMQEWLETLPEYRQEYEQEKYKPRKVAYPTTMIQESTKRIRRRNPWPDCPHKAKNAYAIYCGEQLSTLKNSDIPSKDRMKTVSNLWHALDENGRQTYKQQAEVAKIQYLKDIVKFLMTLTQEERHTAMQQCKLGKEVADAWSEAQVMYSSEKHLDRSGGNSASSDSSSEQE